MALGDEIVVAEVDVVEGTPPAPRKERKSLTCVSRRSIFGVSQWMDGLPLKFHLSSLPMPLC